MICAGEWKAAVSGKSEAELRKEIEAAAEKKAAELAAQKAARLTAEAEQKAAELEKKMRAAVRTAAQLEGKATFLDSITGVRVLSFVRDCGRVPVCFSLLSCCCLLNAGTYHKAKLKFEVRRVEVVAPTAAHERYEAAKQRLRALRESKKGEESQMEAVDVEDRFVYHSCSPDVVPLICANTLRPSLCAKCTKAQGQGQGQRCDDSGLSLALAFCLFIVSVFYDVLVCSQAFSGCTPRACT